MNNLLGEPMKILLVEDNQDHAELIKRGLERIRIANKLYQVTDGVMALDYLYHRNGFEDINRFPLPHLILLDLRLPKLNGLEVLETIKNDEELQGIPVVILTTSEADRDISKAYEHHVNSYLVKPVNFQKFSELMESLGFYWLGWNRYPWNMDGES